MKPIYTNATDYWTNKFIAYMHDPVHKVFDIPGHETKAHDILQTFGLSMPNKKDDHLKMADQIAAGSERGQVPGYSKDAKMSGAIDVKDHLVLTHPTGKQSHLKVTLPASLNSLPKNKKVDEIHRQLISFLENFIGTKAGKGGYSVNYNGKPADFAKARFFLTHLALRFKLAEENVANLGGLWHRLPADSRIPDHSLWQHNALVSSIYSSLELGGGKENLGLMVFSLTPVQGFIAKSRKLRDYWTGSILLSWLAFEGIGWIMEHLGPDHLIYPSLIDQPLVNEYLKKHYELNHPDRDPKLHVTSLSSERSIATFPNKFLAVIPLNHFKTIREGIESSIQKAWTSLGVNLNSWLSKELGESNNTHLKSIIQRQFSDFWDFHFSAVKWTTKQDLSELKRLLDAFPFSGQNTTLTSFEKMHKLNFKNAPFHTQGLFYSTTHQLAQSVLAASKVTRRPKAGKEQGEKCHQCGEFEVLHTKLLTGKASEYKRHIKRVWSQLADRFGSEVKNNERLCAHCALKRFLNRILDKNHILYKTFKQADSFPSTTEIALNSYFMREATDKKERKEMAQRVYEERTLPGMRNEDVYYAILMMDGDKMGDLVNGDTLASTWKSVLHPELVKRLETEGFNPPFSREWKHLFSQDHLNKRLVTPACHASISESLADFSLYGVAPIIQRDTQGSGRLIYAGGDDVCAVLPVQYALDVAQKIRAYYSQSFQFVNSADSLPKGQPIHSENWVPEPGKLSINLGKGDKISISAGILICHHKENLSQMIERAHQLLDRKAKSEGGRNACAIELKKRAGGSRYIVKKWDDKALIRFAEVGQYIADPQNLVGVSTSLVYRLEQFKPGIEAILQQKNWNDLLRAFLSAQLERSELKEPEQACSLIMDLIEHTRGGQRVFDPEPLIIAAFMSKTQKQK